ncbi:M14 family metallopeptidase [Pendulispora brunnea]|uniref:M14 family metallopeptidase n=1 Tax=Pendulispora brunnea TaxID=2905690 RepID=A0ABZ2KPR8_9BACT
MDDNPLQILDSLYRGFRESYLRYTFLTAQVHAWAFRFPELVRVQSIGKSLEGRDLWLLIIGPDPDRVRPAVWVDGNMHAGEVCGSSVALAIAEDVIRMHLTPPDQRDPHGLPPHLRAIATDVLFYVLPRMSPDGAEAVLTEGRYVRSNPRNRRPERHQIPHWVYRDLDGDGLTLAMRQRDETGEFVESKDFPGLMLPRQLEDEGPFYKMYPEGIIEPFDGVTIPDPGYLTDTDTDLNRNFPWSWVPDAEQAGAGAFPTSEPESRAIVAFASEHPEIFAWLNLHTFGGAFLRPLGTAPDKKMNPSDLAVYQQIGAWCEKFTGYPMVSVFEEFLYSPDTVLHGDLAAFGYHQRGAIAYVCELWDFFAQVGLERKRPFILRYSQISREEFVQIARWDREHNQSRILRPWRTFQHPQLGEVEIGGRDPRVGIQNPPYERLAEICTNQAAALFRVAALAPRIVLGEPQITRLGEDTYRVEITVENRGYLPTFVLASAKGLPFNAPLDAEAVAEEGLQVTPPHEARRDVGHLEGWGRGLDASLGFVVQQHARGNVSRRTVSWVVSGRGFLTVRVRSCRTGLIERRFHVGSDSRP